MRMLFMGAPTYFRVKFSLYDDAHTGHLRTCNMPDPAALLDFQITLAAWRRIPRLRAQLELAAHATKDHLPVKLRVPFTATVLLTGNAKVRQLNNAFRSMDKPTNVLSFPQFSFAELPKISKQKHVYAMGDIALAYQYIVAESKKDHKILINHITHLLIHGLLHLFGYDHTDDGQAAHMEKLEIRIMKTLNLPDPYAHHSGAIKTSQRKKTD